MAEASLIVALIGFILIAGAFLKHSSQKRGYPLTLILLLLGILLGPITGIFTPGAAENQVAVTSFITLALILVLFDTGSG